MEKSNRYLVVRRCEAHSWRGFRILELGMELYLVCVDGNTAFLRHNDTDSEEPFEARGWDRLPIKHENALTVSDRAAINARRVQEALQ